MTILFDAECRDELEKSLSKAHGSIYILSAFVKKHALEWFSKKITHNNIQVTVVARWKPQDLLMAASDLSAYKFARDRGWRFAVSNNMHFKIYLIDDVSLFLGSANFTQKGLHIDLDGNDEANIQITPKSIDISRLKQYVDGCCLINDDLYQDMKMFIEQQEPLNTKRTIKWPTKVQQQLHTDIKKLWVNDMLFNSPTTIKHGPNNLKEHDFSLLGLRSDQDLDNLDFIVKNFQKLPLWNWLIRAVSESENEFVRFGEISAKLHEALLDDPKPYRKDVKSLLSNLYDWIKHLNPPGIGIKKFNVTTALFLK